MWRDVYNFFAKKQAVILPRVIHIQNYHFYTKLSHPKNPENTGLAGVFHKIWPPTTVTADFFYKYIYKNHNLSRKGVIHIMKIICSNKSVKSVSTHSKQFHKNHHANTGMYPHGCNNKPDQIYHQRYGTGN